MGNNNGCGRQQAGTGWSVKSANYSVFNFMYVTSDLTQNENGVLQAMS
jgi:hypothetical protein